MGKGEESDPTNASVNTSANTLVGTPLTHYRHVGRHIGRHTFDAFIEKLAFPSSYFVAEKQPIMTLLIKPFEHKAK